MLCIKDAHDYPGGRKLPPENDPKPEPNTEGTARDYPGGKNLPPGSARVFKALF